MESYKVKYKVKGDWLWKTIKDVTGDGIQSHLNIAGQLFELKEPYRFFTTEDGKMIHIPFDAQVIFGKERDIMITKKMSKQAGQQIQRA